MKKTLILGGPGAGKTERLLSIVDDELKAGTHPGKIAFVSFTQKAVYEAQDRAMRKFNLKKEQLPLFRTLHSMCYWQLGVRRSQVMSRRDYRVVGDHVGVEISGKIADDEGMKLGDQMIFLDNLARSTNQSLEKVWQDRHDWDVPWYELYRFISQLKAYKANRGLLDFTDMLERFSGAINADVAIIDEAQDLNWLQWKVAEEAFAKCQRMYIAGDDLQAIHEWAGADVTKFLNLSEDHREVLPMSHRLPRKVFDLAERMASTIKNKYPKEWKPTDKVGSVEFNETVDLSRPGTWYLLARNVCFLKYLEEMCLNEGIAYTKRGGYCSIVPEELKLIKDYEARRSKAGLVSSAPGNPGRPDDRRAPIWHEANIPGLSPDRKAYYVTIRRKGGFLTKPPRVHINTIHGVKGGEADHVILMTDMTRSTDRNLETNPDSETRVFYVGATRAKKTLTILYPTTDRGYQFF